MRRLGVVGSYKINALHALCLVTLLDDVSAQNSIDGGVEIVKCKFIFHPTFSLLSIVIERKTKQIK